MDPLVIPNGLAADALVPPDREAVAGFRSRLRHRTVLSKVARWDPDKRWLLAIQTVRVLKDQGWHPLLIARGGMEAHGAEVLAEPRQRDYASSSGPAPRWASVACYRPWKGLTRPTSCACAPRSTRRVAGCSSGVPPLSWPIVGASRLGS